MKRLAFMTASMFAGLAACAPGGSHPRPTSAAAADQHYEAAIITGSQNVPDDVIKMNTATGDAWVHCCGTKNNNFMHIKDEKPLPQGDYHLLSWSQVEPNGNVNYNLYRFDNKTGHTWVIQTPENGAPSWLDISGTITWQ
jgi:hypothetical protein